MSLNLLFAVDHEVLLGLIRCTVWKQIYKKYSWQPRFYKLLQSVKSFGHMLPKPVRTAPIKCLGWVVRRRAHMQLMKVVPRTKGPHFRRNMGAFGALKAAFWAV